LNSRRDAGAGRLPSGTGDPASTATAAAPPPFRVRHLFLVDLLPALFGVVLLLLLLLAGSTAQAGRPLDPAWSWLAHRTPRDLAGLAIGLVGTVVVIGWLLTLLERLLRAGAPHWAGTGALRRCWPSRLATELSAPRAVVDDLYGLDLPVAWPRLEQVLPDRLRAAVDRRRATCELASRSAATAVLVLVAAIAAAPRWPPYALVLLLVPAALARLSYRAAVRAAAGYGQAVRVAFDLHRFDLLARLHLPLPAGPADERETNRRLCESWAGRLPAELPYRHGAVGTDVLDRVEGAVQDALVLPTPVTFRGVVEVTLQGAEPAGDTGNRRWQIPAGLRSKLQVMLIVGPDGTLSAGRRGQPDDWANPSAIATEFLNVRGRSAPRVEVEVDIDAPFVEVAETHHYLDLASDEDLGIRSTDMVVPRPGRYDLLVTLFSSGRLVQAVPIELLAVE
jgi:hypothetical protein